MFAGYFSPRFAPMEVVVVSHVLVVEDDVDVADLIRTVLTTGGHDVEVAGDGRAGLAAANARRPDVVLLDWMMPGMSGLEVCRALRADESFAQTRVMMVTARSAPQDIEAARAAGVDDYVVKPFSPRELCERVDRLTEH